jgi:preprotein translocase subunit YajC
MSSIIILLFLLLLFWLLLVRPQRSRARQQQALIASLEPGDEVVSTGGIYGTITRIEGDDLYVEIAEGLEVRMARRAVAGYVEPVDEADDEADDEPAELEDGPPEDHGEHAE